MVGRSVGCLSWLGTLWWVAVNCVHRHHSATRYTSKQSTMISVSAMIRSGFLGKYSDSGCRSSRYCRRERHGIAQLFEAAHMVGLHACFVELVQVVGPQISVGHVVTQQVVD